MTMILPPLLQPGDTIGVMAPSSYVEREDIEKSRELLEQKGYRVFIHPQTFERDGQMAGTLLQKTLALQGLWQRDDIKVIWAAGGGNRALHLLETINFEAMKRKPKALIGFSDATALLNGIFAKTGIVTFHGPVFKQLWRHKDTDMALRTLSGEPCKIALSDEQVLRAGKATGPLIGGCLSIFHYLAGTDYCPPPDGAILFLEDTGDHISRYDRMIWHLKYAGVFRALSGIILGEFLETQDGPRPFGFDIQQIVLEMTEGLDIPIISHAPFGHGENLPTFAVGGVANIDTQNHFLEINLKKTK